MNRYGLLLLSLFMFGCATGSVIVTGNVRPAIEPQSVRLYLDEPHNYETIGLVEASSDAGWSEQGDKDYAVAELKKQAAKIGANGVLLTSAGDQTTAIYGFGHNASYAIPVNAKVLKGKAIYVRE